MSLIYLFSTHLGDADLKERLKSRQVDTLINLYEIIYAGKSFYYTDNPVSIQPVESVGGVPTPVGPEYVSAYIERGSISEDLTLEPASVGIRTEMFPWAVQAFLMQEQLEIRISLAVILAKEAGLASLQEVFHGVSCPARLRKQDGLLEYTYIQYSAAKLRQDTLRFTIQKMCNDTLFGRYCQLVKSDYLTTGMISSIDGVNVVVDTLVPDNSAVLDYYTFGSFELVKDDLTFKRNIINHIGYSIVLDRPLLTAEVGDAITMYPGCDKKVETCSSSKFNNTIHFSGVPYMEEEDTTNNI